MELHLKQIITLLQELGNSGRPMSNTGHSISALWGTARQLIARVGSGIIPLPDLDNAGRVLLQLDKIDPGAKAFRYPVRKSGEISRPSDLDYVYIRNFHETMERVAQFLDAAHSMLDLRVEQIAEYE